MNDRLEFGDPRAIRIGHDRRRTWIESPREVDVRYGVGEWLRQQKNRDVPAEQSESQTFYMVHLWNFYPLHMTFAYSEKQNPRRSDCRFYTWRW